MKVLAIESSCDETAAAVVVDGREVLSSVVASQVALHSKYGGVVPELASRRHVEVILPVITEALSRAGNDLQGIEAIAVTQGPGLVGSLLVGIGVAKSIAYVLRIPWVGVNHLQSHISAIFLTPSRLKIPFTALVVSGGHTSLFRVESPTRMNLLGRTLDDAAGEAFDKVAKLMGLGYPGGEIIDRLGQGGGPERNFFSPNHAGTRFLGFQLQWGQDGRSQLCEKPRGRTYARSDSGNRRLLSRSNRRHADHKGSSRRPEGFDPGRCGGRGSCLQFSPAGKVRPGRKARRNHGPFPPARSLYG